MSIKLKTHKKLWGQAANRCAFVDCDKVLTEDTADLLDHYTIGDEAHIKSARPIGPRYDPNFPLDDIDKYDNLILLCKEHHTKIDHDVNFYPPNKLKDIKKKHEDWVTENLKPDKNKQKDDELFAEYIDKIEELSNFDQWHEWSQHFQGNGSFPRMLKIQYDNLVKLHEYLRGRVYPTTHKKLLKAIIQFNLVLEDFINEFHLFMDGKEDSKYYITQQLYRDNTITVERQQLHEEMLERLIIELTKSGNYLCKCVRETLAPSYRLKQGILLLYDYPIAGIAFRRFEYTKTGKYPGAYELSQKARKRLRQ